MKAIVYHRYGSPNVLECAEIERPTPGDDQVLIEVRAASVNPFDWHFMRGTPYFMRLIAGLRRPKIAGLGVDVAGRVEAVGRKVTRFKAGDEVFGMCRGAFAEYACASESALAAKPDNLTFEQAAAIPVGAGTALQGLRAKGAIQPGQKVLINGAAGGVGTFAVQIAKWLGADVTGVCSTRNVDMVRSIGADRVIDYTRDDFTRRWQRYDVIFDCVGNHSLSAFRRVLTPKGIYIVVGGPSGRWFRPMDQMIKILVLSPFVSQTLAMHLSKASKDDLTILRELAEGGTIRPVIDRSYGFNEVPEAIRYLEEGHARGKVVIQFNTMRRMKNEKGSFAAVLRSDVDLRRGVRAV
jgi:NADPH:quinone reductase-like Zn-dependent oxidoreductase